MNIITRFEDGISDEAIFLRLKNSQQLIAGEINVIVVLPKRMRILKGQNKILTILAEGVVANLPGEPQTGVTIVRKIQGLLAMVSPGSEKDKLNAEISFSAKISALFDF